MTGLDDEARRRRYDEACLAGREWASEQMSLSRAPGPLENLRDMLKGEVTAAYVAMRTGRLPSLFFTTAERHEEELDLAEGFFNGASMVLDGWGQKAS